MRSFLRRFGICAWLLWGVISLLILGSAIYTGIVEHSDTYSHRSYASTPVATSTLLDRYRKNLLPPEEREFFVRAVTRLDLNLAPGEEIAVPRTFGARWEFAGAAVIGVTVCAMLLAMLQYLALGYPNPARLFKERI